MIKLNVINEDSYSYSYSPTAMYIQGSAVDILLDDITSDLNKFDDKYNVIKYFYDKRKNKVVFLSYTDMYSGVVNYATVMSYNDAIHSSVDDILMRMNKVKSDDGHHVAYKLIGR